MDKHYRHVFVKFVWILAKRYAIIHHFSLKTGERVLGYSQFPI